MANTISRISSGTGRVEVYASAARTADPDTIELEVAGYRALHMVIDCTAVTSSPSVVFTVMGVDRVSGKTYNLLVSAAITGTGTTVLKVGPGLTAAANVVANDVLPPVIRIKAVHGNSDSSTYSVGASLCV
jgi:hypothetical protein